MLKPEDLKLKFLGIVPQLRDKTGLITPEQIVALSALLTFKGKSVKKLLDETREKGENLEEKVKKILLNSSLRGHASIATTPVLAFYYEASKFLDSMLTGIVFSSSLMASGRRTGAGMDSVMFPLSIRENVEAKRLYRETWKEIIRCYEKALKMGVSQDEISKILPYGMFGTGIICLSVESILSFRREWEKEREWMPEEAGILLGLIEKELRRLGVEDLYWTRRLAPRNMYPYPNIFKDPAKENLARVMVGKRKRVVNYYVDPQPELKKELRELNRAIRQMVKDKKSISKNWYGNLLWHRRIARDWNLAVSFDVHSRVAWRVWGEKKRHRTVPQIVDSIYYAIDESIAKLKTQNSKLIDNYFSVPLGIQIKKEILNDYLSAGSRALVAYQKLLKMKIPPRDAIFIIPRGLRINVLQHYDLYNLLCGFYPLRLCSTAEEQIEKLTIQEANEIKKVLRKKKLPELADLITPKCYATGFCPEREFCGKIKGLVKFYDQDFHDKIMKELRKGLK